MTTICEVLVAADRATATALEEAAGDVVIAFDAAAPADGRTVDRLVDALRSGADLVVGSRFLPGPDAAAGAAGTPRRRWGDAAATSIVNLTCGSRLTDVGAGCAGVWRDRLPAGGPADAGLDLLAAMVGHGAVVVEVPLPAWAADAGRDGREVRRGRRRAVCSALRGALVRCCAGSTPRARAAS